MDLSGTLFFDDAATFRDWLAAHGATERVLFVGFRKVGSGRPSITWPESVDEALCAGWIDGVRQRIDDGAYRIRFTPRRPGSVWSAVNVARAQALIAEGRMTPAGRAAFDARIERKTAVYSYEQDRPEGLTRDEQRRFEADKAAWRWFEAAAPGYRRTMTHWVTSAKQAATRERRLAKLIEACGAGRKLLP